MSNIKSDSTPTIYIGNVNCKVTNVTALVLGKLSDYISAKQPNYWFSNAYRNHTWDGRVRFLNRRNNTFPTGLLPVVADWVESSMGVRPNLIDERDDIGTYDVEPVEYGATISEGITARDYQVDAVNAIIENSVDDVAFNRGVINIATNGGKTAIASMYLSRLLPLLRENDSTFLFVTHSKEIAGQTRRVLEGNLGTDIGMIGAGQWDVQPISVAIVATLYRRRGKPEMEELIQRTVGFIADECHHSSSTSWFEVFQSLSNAQIRVGLTGTVDRKNPVNYMRLYSCTSQIVCRVSNDQLIRGGYSARPVCIFMQVDRPNVFDASFEDAYDLGIVHSLDRTMLMVDICRHECETDNTVLILVDRIEQGELIQRVLTEKGIGRVWFTNGQLGNDERADALDATRNDQLDVLIATSILDEGVDISGINAIIYARGLKSQRRLLQGIGRGLRRKYDGSSMRFYDFIDNTNEKLLEHSRQRYLTLKHEGFEMLLFSREDYLRTDLSSL